MTEKLLTGTLSLNTNKQDLKQVKQIHNVIIVIWPHSLRICTRIGSCFRNMSHCTTKPTNDLCAQRRLRSSWASAQIDQSYRCPHEKNLGSLAIHWAHSKDGGCPCWSESSLDEQAILLLLSCSGSYMLRFYQYSLTFIFSCTNQTAYRH